MESPASSAVKKSSSCFLFVAIQRAGCSQLREEQRLLFGEGSAGSEPSLPQAGCAECGCEGGFPLWLGGAAVGGRGSAKWGASVGLD